MWAPTYDSHNDQFAAQLSCPWPNCGATENNALLSDAEVWVCSSCSRPYEVVRLTASPALKGESAEVARRPGSLFCARTGAPLTGTCGADFDQAGGSATRSSTLQDGAGRIFGRPRRTVEWDLELGWTTQQWGGDEEERENESVTSVSVHRGLVLCASASGRMGLFDAATGTPRLSRSLVFPGAAFDASSREHALRLPVAFRAGKLCAITERFALFRDLTTSLFPHAPVAKAVSSQKIVEAGPHLQWIGAPLIASGRESTNEPSVVLVEGSPRGAQDAPENVALRFFDLHGNARARLEIPGLVRPPVEIAPGKIVTVNDLGHVFVVDTATQSVELHALPEKMLQLATTERWHLVFAPSAKGGELWLADEASGRIRVWRAPLSRVVTGAFTWEERFEAKGLGALLSLAVGPVVAGVSHPATEHYVLTTERSVAAYARAVRQPAAEAVLARPPSGPALLTSVGFVSQDDSGIWLRGLGAWSFRDDNRERRLRPPIARPPPALHDRTMAAYGRQLFFATGSAISMAKFVPQDR